MGKYIVELKKNETLYKAATRESDGTAYVCSAIGTPYTEPDLEQVRKESYDKGYDDAAEEKYNDGLADAWEASRKIRYMTWKEQREVFGTDLYTDIIALPVSECIEKIRQYEQEKDRQARIEYNFDEIKDVLETTAKECNVSLDEIAEVLQKMKETDNG